MFWISTLLVLLIGIPLSLWQLGKDPVLGYLAFGTVVVYEVIVGWVFWSNTREDRLRVRENLEALRRDEAEVVRCQSNHVARVEEQDLPILFFYQADDDTILFCELYAEEARDKAFPNSEFEVAKIYGPNGRLDGQKATRPFLDGACPFELQKQPVPFLS
jgi:hypothetical protein